MTALMHTSEPPAEKNETSHPKPQEAVLAVGAVLELAHLVGPAPNLSDIPKRELSVEVVMNLASEILWPELGHEQPVEIDDIDANRAQEYSLLAMLLVRPPDAATLSRIAALQGDTTPLGLAHLTFRARSRQCERGEDRSGVLQPFHWSGPRRVASLRIILSHRLSQRTAAGAIARRSPRAPH